MKKLFTLMAVCLLALASGCGGQSQSTTSAKEPVELHVVGGREPDRCHERDRQGV